jgi:threonine/homoserine/homoserine lactone efflux protein
MLGTHDLQLFILSGLLLNITPGADSLYIVARSISQGWRAGMAAAFGISLGCYVHIFAAAIGLSAALATSASAFTVVKLVGAVYLLYLGISLVRSSPPTSHYQVAAAPVLLRTVFWQGFLTNVLNPKVALFFLAFVPQFIEPSAVNKALAFVFLGAIFNFTGTVWCLFLAWSAAHLSRRAVHNRHVFSWLTRGVGSLFIFLGLKLAISKQS